MKKKLICLIVVVVIAIAATVLILVLPREKDSEADLTVYDVDGTHNTEPIHSQRPRLELRERRELDDTVVIDTTYCTLCFPYAFGDLVAQEVVDDGERIAIDFYAVLSGEKYPIYTISFSGEGDIPLGELKAEEVSFEVSARFCDDAVGLEGDDLVSFRAAQETFNDIWVSLEANENFESAQQ